MTEQKVILITGCSSGIGLTSAVYLSGKGYKVYATMRDLQRKDKLFSEINKAGVSLEILQLDVTDEKSVRNAVNIVVEKEGKIDVLINNAGFGSGGFLEDFTMDEIKSQFETNFFGLIRVIQSVLPAMRKQQNGIILNISSIDGKIAFPVISIYNASKFAVEALTESLRVELAPFGIKVTAIEPAGVNTNFNTSTLAAKKSESSLSPYYEYFVRFKKNIDKMSKQGDEPVLVAETIYKAITSKNLKRSYTVGKNSKVLLILKKILPNQVFENTMGKQFLG